MSTKKKICIIGAGPSGLCTAKEIQENNPNIDVKVFEKSDAIGGVFSNCYEGLSLVNNPFLISFSDFPPQDSCDDLRMWKAKEYVDYLNRYAKYNHLLPLIFFNHTVQKINKKGKQWEVCFQKDGDIEIEIFDYLAICSGANHKARKTHLPNQEKFSGEVIYGGNTKKVSGLKGKKVVFVGLGETASDLVYLSRNLVRQSYVSVRRWPGYFIPRYHDNKPTDLDTSNIYHALSRDVDDSRLSFLTSFKRKLEYKNIALQEDKQIQNAMNHFNSSYKSINYLGPFRRVTTKSCGFIKAYLEDKTSLKPEIVNLEGKKVIFKDGSSVLADTIVLCTGNTFNLSFLPDDILDKTSSINKLYKYIFIPDVEHCYFIGFARPNLGSLPSVAELQARYLSAYLKQEIDLPNQEKMQQEILNQQQRFKWQFPVDFERITHLVDYYWYTRLLAKDLNALPKQWRLFFLDIHLWYKVNFSFLYPGIYRLYPHNAKSKKIASIIKKFPTMNKKVLFVETILYLLNKLSKLFSIK
ncbi:Monooxygenase [Bathymodiolus thermophilus thioautotrophic gill symbiont]|uniref:flavin-containing monooxygenase n=1 Tax=Bathymodiolus thermophilus thioautotrophic gill symbiont TaxID=2360 RepID=UPI0010B37AA3|nr:NAD(P)-binding domain-containing protein [Bathymodiolus thermophilus thioautotrophic gill symbiont]SHA07346.1 Monooxygenase [Bathymodiolus thermophilus thioautotrophic gill symbiont]